MAVSRRRLLVLGASLAASARVFAQSRSRVVRLGVLELAPSAKPAPGRRPDLLQEFVAALNDRGWAAGRNLLIEARSTAAEPERAVDTAREFLKNGADLLVTIGTANALAARQATSTVPIVMLASGFPVESGLAQSYARPGGNVTGLRVYADEVFAKYVGLIKDLVPALKTLGVFWGYAPPAFPEIETRLALGEMQRAAAALNIGLRIWQNPNRQALQASMREAASVPLQALFVSSGSPQAVPENVQEIARFCEARRLPTMCDINGIFFQAGGVLAYSVDVHELGLRGAAFVDRILRGANPAQLPIEQPTRFLLIINARRAKSIGIAIPAALLARADRVIE